jgi:hypothetical protein
MRRLLDLLAKLSGKRPDAVVSYPKAGRTWLRVMTNELRLPLTYTHAGSNHGSACHFSQLAADATQFNRIVFLHRDPRDTAVSGFYQVDRRMDGYQGTISDFIRDPRHGVEKVATFNMLWLEAARGNPNILPITYEALKRDTVGRLGAICEFLGRHRELVELQATVANNSFERMKEREAVGDFKGKERRTLSPKDAADPNSFKVRRGKVGGFVDEITPDDVSYCASVLSRFPTLMPLYSA